MTEQAPTPTGGEADRTSETRDPGEAGHHPPADLREQRGWAPDGGRDDPGDQDAAAWSRGAREHPGPPVAAAAGPPGGLPAPAGRFAGPVPPPPPPPDAVRAPSRVEPIPGTPLGLVYLEVPPVVSGLAVSALVAGIGAIGVSFLVGCFGVVGARPGWGAWAAGAFAVLGLLAGGAAIVAGMLGMRQIRRAAPPPAVRFTGRGLAVAGVSCGAAGVALTLLGLGLAVLLQVR